MKTIEFFFDLSSPYSYLTATQLESLAQRTGAQVIYKPMVLAAVFKATGNTMPAVVPAKARHMLTDLSRWAAEYGVPFQMSSRFPVNGIKAARMVIGAEAAGKSGALTQACFAALWTADRDITADAELRALATQVGLPADEALAAIETPAIKDRLRAYTDEAIARGVFGAPAIFVGTELFWGNDRLHFVEQALLRQSA
jgi:2-hydroxychromene-2-carboxylate isomerase